MGGNHGEKTPTSPLARPGTISLSIQLPGKTLIQHLNLCRLFEPEVRAERKAADKRQGL